MRLVGRTDSCPWSEGHGVQPVESEVSDAKWLHHWGQQVTLTSHGAPAILGPLGPARLEPPSAETLRMTQAALSPAGPPSAGAA